MKRNPLPRGKLALLAWIGAVCLLAMPAYGGTTEPVLWVARASNAFATELYAKLAASQTGNLFFSPASIETALAMTYAGARGETATQMAAVLHFPASGDVLQKQMGDLIKRWNGTGSGTRAYQLSTADGLWAELGYAYLPAFLKIMTGDYMAGLNEVEFSKDPEAARARINHWVEMKTAGKISDLIQPGILTKATRLVIANAIYFKGSWTDPFEKAATRPEPFHAPGQADKSVPMMQRTNQYAYMEDKEVQALQLKYAGGDLSMVILLPRDANGLAHVEQGLSQARLGDIMGALQEQRVAVSIPRFTMTHAFELGETLRSMGMKDAFSDAADFSGMTGKRDLAISNVIHKAYVDVNEQGTEAAAATAVTMRTLAIYDPKPVRIFRADHPFMFLIREESSGAILFMGRMVDPEAPGK